MIRCKLLHLLERLLPAEDKPLPELPAIVADSHLHELLVCLVSLLPFFFKQFKFDVWRLQFLYLRFQSPNARLSKLGYVVFYVLLSRFFAFRVCGLLALLFVSGRFAVDDSEIVEIKVATLCTDEHILHGFWIQVEGGVWWLGFDPEDKLLLVLLKVLVDDVSCLHVQPKHALHAGAYLRVEVEFVARDTARDRTLRGLLLVLFLGLLVSAHSNHEAICAGINYFTIQ